MTGAAATHASAQACAAAPLALAHPIRQVPHGGFEPIRPMTADTVLAAAATPMTSLREHPGARRREEPVAARTAAVACSRVHAQGGCTGACVHATVHCSCLGGTFVLHPRAQLVGSLAEEQPTRQFAHAAFVDIIAITAA